MGSRDKVVTLAVTGGIFLALGVWTTHWWSGGDGLLRVGLREAKICMPPMPCIAAPFDQQLTASGSFPTLANLTYWIGLLGAALLFGHAYLASKQDEHRVGWAAGAASAAAAALAIATVASKPAELAMLGMSWSFPLALIGAALGVAAAIPSLVPGGAIARARQQVAGVTDRGYRAVVGPLADLTDPRAEVPEARVVDRPTPPAGTAAPAAATAAESAPAPTPEVAADTLETLRFVAHRLELNDYGLDATMRNGARHQLAWDEIARVVMRQLPQEAPYRGVLMLDLLAADARAPIRLLPTTILDPGALPDCTGASPAESFKKLAVLVRERNPAAHLDGNPPTFASPAAFLDYDAGFGA